MDSSHSVLAIGSFKQTKSHDAVAYQRERVSIEAGAWRTPHSNPQQGCETALSRRSLNSKWLDVAACHRVGLPPLRLSCNCPVRVQSTTVHGQEKAAIVLDIGASFVRCGHAGEATPRVVVPSPRCLKEVDYDGVVPPVRMPALMTALQTRDRELFRVHTTHSRTCIYPSQVVVGFPFSNSCRTAVV